MTLASAAAGASAAGNSKTQYYLLRQYYLKNGSQTTRIHEFLSQGLLPAANRILPGPKIFLDAFVAAHQPQVVAILGLRSLEDFAALEAAPGRDAELQKALARWESGDEAPYEYYSQSLLRAADYSGEIAPLASEARARIFELRVYHSPTWRQLAALHRRFAGPEIKIFHRVGVHPILYAETVAGANMPNLTYLTPFESLAAREKAWDAFAADPEWIKVRKESTEAYGQISSVINITLLRGTGYSPVR